MIGALRDRLRRRRERRACAAGYHDWDRTLDGVRPGTYFYAIRCRRDGCDYAMDAVSYLRLLDELPPRLRRDMERRGPQRTRPPERAGQGGRT